MFAVRRFWDVDGSRRDLFRRCPAGACRTVRRKARWHAIGLETMARTYRSVRDETGERNSRLEAELVRLEEAASQDLRGLAKAGRAEFSHPE